MVKLIERLISEWEVSGSNPTQVTNEALKYFALNILQLLPIVGQFMASFWTIETHFEVKTAAEAKRFLEMSLS